MRFLAPALVLAALPLPAWAGGIGVIGNYGMHGDTVYPYYMKDNGDFEQCDPQHQMNGNFGGGIEVVLGDRDNKILGIFRGYYIQDAAQRAPRAGGECKQPVFDDGTQPDGLTYAIRETGRDVGVINAGLQFGVLGDPNNIQLTIVNTYGAGLYTNDLTEFATVELGVGGTWMAERRVQVHASVTGGLRYRKSFYPTGNAYAGVRYLFD
ncbi:MAG: hypothetical protein ACOZNI_05860 [Myxococcota bacterium]